MRLQIERELAAMPETPSQARFRSGIYRANKPPASMWARGAHPTVSAADSGIWFVFPANWIPFPQKPGFLP